MAGETERKPWDQLESEPAEAYARFLIYRNLGPARSLDAAYRVVKGDVTKRGKALQAPGNWAEESAAYQWPARAAAWDIDALLTMGQAVVAKYVALVDAVAERALQALADEKVRPRSYAAVLEALETLNEIVTAEAVAEAKRNSGAVPAIGGRRDGVNVTVNTGGGSAGRVG